MPAYSSEILYHMVGSGHPRDHAANVGVLHKILASMEIRPCKIGDMEGVKSWRVDPERPIINGEPIEQTVTCFCDIPLESLRLHANKYGEVGVGVDRTLVAGWGGRPVIYVPVVPSSPFSLVNRFVRDAKSLSQALDQWHPGDPRKKERRRTVGAALESLEETVDEVQSFLQAEILAYLKQFNVELDEGDKENFYLEREWRKYGKLELHMALKTIVAPPRFHAEIREQHPNLQHIPLMSVPPE